MPVLTNGPSLGQGKGAFASTGPIPPLPAAQLERKPTAPRQLLPVVYSLLGLGQQGAPIPRASHFSEMGPVQAPRASACFVQAQRGRQVSVRLPWGPFLSADLDSLLSPRWAAGQSSDGVSQSRGCDYRPRVLCFFHAGGAQRLPLEGAVGPLGEARRPRAAEARSAGAGHCFSKGARALVLTLLPSHISYEHI